MNRFLRYIMLPLILPLMFFAVAFSSVAVLGCRNREAYWLLPFHLSAAVGIESGIYWNKGKDSKQSRFSVVGVKRTDIGNTRRWNDSFGVDADRINLYIEVCMKTVMFYEMAPDSLSKVIAHVDEHKSRLETFHKRGVLLMAGPYADPAEGAMGIFTNKEAAEEFIKDDPFFINGVVGKWRLVEWNEVLA